MKFLNLLVLAVGIAALPFSKKKQVNDSVAVEKKQQRNDYDGEGNPEDEEVIPIY